MAEEFQGGVCGGTWWNPPRSLFSGGLTSPCSVAQLGGGGGGGFDMGTFGWPNDVLIKGNNNKPINLHNSFENSLVFPADLDSTLDILGFGLSPTSSTTTDWSQPNLLINGGGNEVNYGSIMLEDENLKINSSNFMNSNISSHDNMMNNCNNSPPMAASGDSSTITSEGGLVTNSSFQMSSSASYLIQTLFDDTDDSQVLEPQLATSRPMNNPNYGHCVMGSSHDQLMLSPNIPPIQHSLQLGQNNELHGGMNGQYSTATALSNIRASLLNSLKSRSRAPTQSCAYLATNKANMEEVHDSKGNLNDQPPSKRPRIETPSSMPTFKVRKEKLGDRITALQQLVSPFGKTDTASVLHEAIEYIKFLHDQVSALSTPYLKNGAAPMQHHQENEVAREDLRSRGLCLVPMSSTYPIVQETSVDFWTPTFGGPEFR